MPFCWRPTNYSIKSRYHCICNFHHFFFCREIVYRLDVSGKRFLARKSTLTKEPDSLLNEVTRHSSGFLLNQVFRKNDSDPLMYQVNRRKIFIQEDDYAYGIGKDEENDVVFFNTDHKIFAKILDFLRWVFGFWILRSIKI